MKCSEEGAAVVTPIVHGLAQGLLLAIGFDLDIVSNMSDPAREAADCGAHIQFYEDQPAAIIESDASSRL
jgi:hypothetical protein